jgi:hypothetical protein
MTLTDINTPPSQPYAQNHGDGAAVWYRLVQALSHILLLPCC